jgi:sRNA-binding carbon storage regulator CsrA
MLVYARKKGEAVVFGPDQSQICEVVVVDIHGSMVRLMCEVPSHWQIGRRQVAEYLQTRARHMSLVSREGADRTQAEPIAEPSPQARAMPADDLIVGDDGRVELSLGLNEKLLIEQATVTVVKIDRDKVRLGIECPSDWLADRSEAFLFPLKSKNNPEPTNRTNPATDPTIQPGTADASVPTGGKAQKARSPEVAEILSMAGGLDVPEQLEELTSGLLALRAKSLAPVASSEETKLLLSINEGVPAELTNRAASLIEKRDNSSLTADESNELLELAEEVERRGVERLEALSNLAELRGVPLRDLMLTLGVTTRDHG